MKTGISLYFSNGVEKNEAIIRKARKAGIRYAFTSMHIPEETGIDYRGDARKLLAQCRDAGINLIVDVSPVTLEKLGCASLPVCIAKTQYSLSDNPRLSARPRGFSIKVSQLRLSAGAGFTVVLTGDIMTMPGLPRVPAACKIDVTPEGKITGLF